MFDFTDEQKMVRKMVRQWAQKELAPNVAAMEKGEITPYDIMRKLLKTFGMDEMVRTAFANMKPDSRMEKPGGSGERSGHERDRRHRAVAHQPRLSRWRSARRWGWPAAPSAPRARFAQKQKYALPILTGEKIGAWGMTEPGAGSDAFGSMRTVARRDGDHFVLNGQKTFITNAPFADTFVIYAKIAETRRGRYPASADSRLHRRAGQPTGLPPASPWTRWACTPPPPAKSSSPTFGCHKNQLLGEKEKDPSKEQARDVFHGERTGMVPMCLGIIERCLEDSLEYSKQRESPGASRSPNIS